MKFSFTNIFLLLVSSFFLFAVIRSFDLQILNGNKYKIYSNSIFFKQDSIIPNRGYFFDRNLNQLVNNVNKYVVYLYNKNYSVSDLQNISALLKKINIDSNGIFDQLHNSNSDILIPKSLSSSEFSLLNSESLFSSYFSYYIQNSRSYSYPFQFAHIIGFTGLPDSEDIALGYQVGEQLGKYKLERQLEQSLKGVKGFSNSDFVIAPKNGSNIVLTIDLDWQLALYKIIEKYSLEYNTVGAAGVILNNISEVIAQVSYPGFNTNLFSSGITDEQYSQLSSQRNLPFIDKAVSLQIAPGSILKLITAYTLLEEGIVDGNTIYYSNRCLNKSIYNFDFCEYQKFFYGNMNIERALFKSSNLFFCNYALRIQNDKYKLDKFFSNLNSFGLGKVTGIDLEGEYPGLVDSPDYKASLGLGWYSGDTCNAVIGQGSNVVTPIQMALVAQAFNNNGLIYQPKIIKTITNIDGVSEYSFSPSLKSKIEFSNSTYSLINSAMSNVAYNYEGTVSPFLNHLPNNLKVKTGTAEAFENINGEFFPVNHGWIIGSLEYKNQKYFFSIVLNLGGGGFYVAQILRDFVQCLNSDFADLNCK